MQHHYSHRKVNGKFYFGLLEHNQIVGCVVYSQPASYTLCKGVCGDDFKPYVIELSRLVVTTSARNAASRLIGQSLKQLGDAIVVSYADANVGHVGYVYQATNWLYTGRSSAEPKWVNPDNGEVVSVTRRHIDKKAEAIGKDWRDLVKVKQMGKHRYVSFQGDRRFRKKARAALNYPVIAYPKGPTNRIHSKPKKLPGELF